MESDAAVQHGAALSDRGDTVRPLSLLRPQTHTTAQEVDHAVLRVAAALSRSIWSRPSFCATATATLTAPALRATHVTHTRRAGRPVCRRSSVPTRAFPHMPHSKNSSSGPAGHAGLELYLVLYYKNWSQHLTRRALVWRLRPGAGFLVVAEGLNGRTTVIDDPQVRSGQHRLARRSAQQCQ